MHEYKDNFPFITGLKYSGSTEYFGIVVNHDNSTISFYDIAKMSNQQLLSNFLQLGETWWWESNRQLPIDVFLHIELRPYHACLTTLAMKDVEHMFGPMTTLQNLLKKRIKRKGIQLVKKVD
jgi:hypothetical protein